MPQEELITFKPFVARSVDIVSPKLDPTDQPYLTVPCTNNHFNRKRMQSDWFVRAFYESKNSFVTFFVTCTYDEFSLPVMLDGRPAFCRYDVQVFFKRLRNYLRRRCGIDKDAFRYLVVSEYGKTTHRPHYHMLFFFKCPIIAALFEDLVRTAWIHGFCDVEEANTDAVISYCTKYVCKDVFSNPEFACLNSFGVPNVGDYITRRVYNQSEYAWLKTAKIQPPYSVQFLHQRDSETKEIQCEVTTYNFHLQSLGFGSALLDSITGDEWKRGYIVFGDGVRVFKYAIPKYAVDHICRFTEYWKDDSGTRHSRTSTTAFGEQVRSWRLDSVCEQVKDFVTKFSDTHNSDYIQNLLCIDDSEIFKNLSFDYFKRKNKKILDNDPYQDFRQFVHVYKGRLKFGVSLIDVDTGKRPFVPFSQLWDSEFAGWTELLNLVRVVTFEQDCLKQRSDEKQEYKLLKRKFYERRNC